jgi:hypothetical protein
MAVGQQQEPRPLCTPSELPINGHVRFSIVVSRLVALRHASGHVARTTGKRETVALRPDKATARQQDGSPAARARGYGRLYVRHVLLAVTASTLANNDGNAGFRSFHRYSSRVSSACIAFESKESREAAYWCHCIVNRRHRDMS